MAYHHESSKKNLHERTKKEKVGSRVSLEESWTYTITNFISNSTISNSSPSTLRLPQSSQKKSQLYEFTEHTPPTQQITTPSKRPKTTTITKSVEFISTPDNSSEKQANLKDKSTPTTAKEHYDLRTSPSFPI